MDHSVEGNTVFA